MKKANNKGVSLIEILIAVVVFTICITPIVMQLTTGIRIGNKAKDQQAATDYARSIAETMKQMQLQEGYDSTNLSDLESALDITTGTMIAENTFYSVKQDGTTGTIIPANSTLKSYPGNSIAGGTNYSSVTDMYQQLNAANKSLGAASKEALVRQYVFKGDANVEYRDYDVEITMNTKPYAIESLTNASYKDPNSVNLNNLSDLDANNEALITRASNYDATATVSFYNATIAALQRSDSIEDQQKAVQIMNGNATIGDSATKETIIEINPITDATGNKYEVSCSIVYTNTDPLGVLGSEKSHKYGVFDQKFKELPEVYLMYNQFVYGTSFQDDLITIKNNVREKAKVYVIRTVADDSNINRITTLEGADGGNLIPTGKAQCRDDMNGTKYLYQTQFVIENDATIYPVEVYTNIPMHKDDGTLNVGTKGVAGDRNYKMVVKANLAATYIVRPLSEDERYSAQGRMYEIVVKLTNKDTGVETTFDTSKGDY